MPDEFVAEAPCDLGLLALGVGPGAGAFRLAWVGGTRGWFETVTNEVGAPEKYAASNRSPAKVVVTSTATQHRGKQQEGAV